MSASSPTFSIVLPFRNPGAYFSLALRSVFAQTFEDWELLLLDDGSTDGSLETARSIQDSRVRVYSDGIRRGSGARRNQGVRESRGRYVALLDADDAMTPTRLQLQYEVLRGCGADTVVAGDAYAIDAESTVRGMRAGPGIINPTVAASREWFVKNPYSEDIAFLRAQDFELWTRTASFLRIIHIDAPLIYYRCTSEADLESYTMSSFAMMRVYTMYSYGRRRRLLSRVTAQLVKLWLVNLSRAFSPAAWRIDPHTKPVRAGKLRSAALLLTQIADTPFPVAVPSD